MSDVVLAHSDGIATIALNRSPVNALTVAMMRELIDALAWVDGHDEGW